MKYQSRILEGMPKPRAPKYTAALIPAFQGILSLIIFAVLTIEWLPKLSEKIATHWGIDGAPNDFQSPWFVFILVALMVLIFTGIGLFVSIGGIKRDVFFKPHIWTNAVIIGLNSWLAISLLGSLYIQIDRDPKGVWVTELLPWFGYGILAGVLLALIYGFATQKFADEYTRTPSKSPILPIADTAKGIWIGRIAAPAFFKWLLTLTVLALFVFALFMLWEVWLSVILLLTALIVGAAALTLSWNVVVSEKGFSAMSALGVWRVSIPLEKIENASVTMVEPLTDFGGYGLRLNPSLSLFGIVLQKGDALIIQRKDKKRGFVVTVDDAETGAGLLNAYLSRTAKRM